MKSELLEKLLFALPDIRKNHALGTEFYSFLKMTARKEVEDLFSGTDENPRELKPFGELIFPYHEMGAIDSLNLFDIDELIIFSFYWINRNRYRRVADIGANIGLHSIILSKCGYEVCSYEPDPKHFEVLERNLKMNKCFNVQPFCAAVSSKAGEMKFVRVLGNLTASHLVGSKANPYGELEKFPVKVEAIGPIMEWADLIKLDAEGHEKEILLATNEKHWLNTDALIEVENENNASLIYEHLKTIGVKLFSQKTNWQPVKDISGMPTSYREGTLFATSRSETPWA